MSGRISISFVDFTAALFDFDHVPCVSIKSFLVRNGCGPWPSVETVDGQSVAEDAFVARVLAHRHDSDEEAQTFQRRSSHTISWQVFGGIVAIER
jgi:hypothetical protein